MKKCPKCGAELAENARFCLFCMTSFEGKQVITAPKISSKRWIYIITALLLVALIILSVFLIVPDESRPNGINSKGKNAYVAENQSNTTQSKTQDGEPTDNGNFPNNESSGAQNSHQNGNDESNPILGNTTTQNSYFGSSTSGGTSSENTNTNTSRPSNGTTENTSAPTTSTTSSKTSSAPKTSTSESTNTEPSFSYVTATLENAYPTGYSALYAPENAIVITKVNYKAENGNYVIPERIDGKKVGAIMPSAFSDSSISASVKSVTLPSTVRTIWSDAFKNCYNLTNLYLKSQTIAIYKDAFPDASKRNGKLTIHCSSDCKNFDFYYYRNIAYQYNATYKEWNG